MKSSIPFQFVVEELERANPFVRPMFGCHAIYVGNKIVLVLRNREDYPRDNGVWVATGKEHHESLKTNFPSLRSLELFGGSETNWQNIPAEADDFEESVIQVCSLIVKGDPRIGRIPKLKKKKRRTR